MTALVLACLLSAQPASTITYSSEAKPVGVVLQEISRATGLQMKADADAAHEIVLVEVKDMPLQSFLARLASVTSCVWDKASERWVLKPDQRRRTKEAEEEFQKRTQAISKSIQVLLKAQQGQAKDEGDPEKTDADPLTVSPLGDGSGSTALNRILANLDPASIAWIGPGLRGVWASNGATSMQRTLPDGSNELITAWIQDHNSRAAKLKADAASKLPEGMPQGIIDMIHRESQPVSKPPAKALLVIKRSNVVMSWLGVQVSLVAYDNQGSPLVQTQTMLDFQLGDLMAKAATKSKTASPGTETPIPFTDDSKALIRAFGHGGAAGFMVSVPPDLRSKLMHPEKKDPLAYFVTDELQALAKHRGEQLIADLPDSSFGLELAGTNGATTIEDVQRELDEGTTVAATTEEDCLLVRPAKPDEERRSRIDRDSLAVLLAAVEAKRQPSLDDVCAYALANEPPFSSSIGMTYCMALVPSLMGISLTSGMSNWNLYRLYGSLSSAQRENLRAGGRLLISDLSEPQRGYAAGLLFGADAQFRAADKKPGSTDMISQVMGFLLGSSSSGTMDPTELMPNGLPLTSYITCAFNEEPVVEALEDSGAAAGWCFSAGDLAVLDTLKSAGASQDLSAAMPKNGLLGERTDLNFTFHIGQTAALDQTLWDTVIAADAQKVALDALPADLQALVDKQKADLKNSPLGMLQSLPMFRNVAPP
jgi:hypothetical protein